jgi:hypothetical protein
MLLSLDTKIKDDHNLPDRMSVYEYVLIEPVHVTLVVKGQLNQFSLRWVSMHQKPQWPPPTRWEMQNDGIQLIPIAWTSFDCPRYPPLSRLPKSQGRTVRREGVCASSDEL